MLCSRKVLWALTSALQQLSSLQDRALIARLPGGWRKNNSNVLAGIKGTTWAGVKDNKRWLLILYFQTSRAVREVDHNFVFFLSKKEVTLFISLHLDSGIFSLPSWYLSSYIAWNSPDAIVGNVLNLLPRFPEGKVNLRSMFSQLFMVWVQEPILHSAKSTEEPLLEICCWQRWGNELI